MRMLKQIRQQSKTPCTPCAPGRDSYSLVASKSGQANGEVSRHGLLGLSLLSWFSFVNCVSIFTVSLCWCATVASRWEESPSPTTGFTFPVRKMAATTNLSKDHGLFWGTGVNLCPRAVVLSARSYYYCPPLKKSNFLFIRRFLQPWFHCVSLPGATRDTYLDVEPPDLQTSMDLINGGNRMTVNRKIQQDSDQPLATEKNEKALGIKLYSRTDLHWNYSTERAVKL